MLQSTSATTIFIVFVSIMNHGVVIVMATKHYIFQCPKTDQNMFHARCYAGANCTYGWYKANLANTWGLCKVKEDPLNKR